MTPHPDHTQLSASADAESAMPVFRTEQELSLLDLMIIAAQHRRAIIKGSILATAVAAAIAFALPKKYTATAVIMPPQQSTSLGAAIASQLGSLGSVASLSGGGLGLKGQNDMYIGLIRSHTVEDALIQRFGLQHEYKKRYLSDTRKKLEEMSSIDGSGKDGLIHISVEDWDPHKAAALANGFVDEYRRLSQTLAITEAAQRRLFFQKQLEDAQANLTNAEVALKTTEESTGVIQLDAQARALIESAATIRAQIAAKEVQIEAMRTYAAGENAQLALAQSELDGLKSQLAKLTGNGDPDASSLIVPKGRVTEASLEYLRKVRDVKYQETLFDILARQFEVAKLDEAKEGSVIQVVDPALTPDKKSFPPRAVIVIGTAVLSLFAGFIIALLNTLFEAKSREPEIARKLEILHEVLNKP